MFWKARLGVNDNIVARWLGKVLGVKGFVLLERRLLARWVSSPQIVPLENERICHRSTSLIEERVAL